MCCLSAYHTHLQFYCVVRKELITNWALAEKKAANAPAQETQKQPQQVLLLMGVPICYHNAVITAQTSTDESATATMAEERALTALTSLSERPTDAVAIDARTQHSHGMLRADAKMQMEDDDEAGVIKDGNDAVVTAQTSTNESATATMAETRAPVGSSEHLTDAVAIDARTQHSHGMLRADAKMQVEDNDEAEVIEDGNAKRRRLAAAGGPCHTAAQSGDPPTPKRFKPLAKQLRHLESHDDAKIGQRESAVRNDQVDGAVMITDSACKQVVLMLSIAFVDKNFGRLLKRLTCSCVNQPIGFSSRN